MNPEEAGSELGDPSTPGTSASLTEPDIFDTGQGLPQVKREPELHRGVITAVTSSTFDSGATAIVFHLRSLDADFEGEYLLWVPKAWVENIYIPKDQLPTGELDPRTGKIAGNQREQLAIRISNSDGTAELQRVTAIAKTQDRTPAALGLGKPENFTEYVAALSQLLTNVSVVFRRAADNNAEPQFRNALKIQGIYEPHEIMDKPKRLRDHVRLWERE